MTGWVDTSGGLFASGEIRADEQGRLSFEDRAVWGTFSLSVDGVQITGRQVMTITGQLDPEDTGAIYGTFSWIADVSGASIVLWEGHWAGQCVRRVLSGTLIGRGRERFAGRRLRASFRQTGTAPTSEGEQLQVEGRISAASHLGVTGISTALGGVVSPGETFRDTAGNLNIRKQAVAGALLLDFDGVRIEGTQIFYVDAILDDQSSGLAWGTFTLSMRTGEEEVIVFEGHWAGHLERLIGVSKMIACGRGPFAGYKLYLDMEEIPAFETTPDPNVYLLDGFAVVHRGVGVTGLSDAFGGDLEPGRSFVDERGRLQVRDRVVLGGLSLTIGGETVEGKEIFRVQAALDESNSGPVYGSFLLTTNDEALLWKGHWAGRFVELIGTSEMVGIGFGPFAGRKIHLRMEEIAAFEGNPDPNLFLLDGEVSEQEGTGVTGIATVAGGLVGPGGGARDELGRRRLRRTVEGDLSLFLGDREVLGRQILELDAFLDDRHTGPVEARFQWIENGQGARWQGVWSGRLRNARASGPLVGRGANGSSGSRIYLEARESDAGESGGDLSVLLLDGFLIEPPAGGRPGVP